MVTRPPGGWAPGSVHGTLTASQLATPVDGVRSFKASWLKTMLYLFSGATRKASIAAFLQKLSSGTGIQFQVHEIDIQNSPEWDLNLIADHGLQQKLLQELAQGEYHVVLATSSRSKLQGATYDLFQAAPVGLSMALQ